MDSFSERSILYNLSKQLEENKDQLDSFIEELDKHENQDDIEKEMKENNMLFDQIKQQLDLIMKNKEKIDDKIRRLQLERNLEQMEKQQQEEEKKGKEEIQVQLPEEMNSDLRDLKQKNELKNLQQIIKNNTNCIVQNYLYRRQTLMYEKFLESDQKLSDKIKENEMRSESIMKDVKNSLQTIQRSRIPVIQNYQPVDDSLNTTFNEIKDDQTREATKNNLAKSFLNAQLLDKYKEVDICREVKNVFNQFPILSIGEVMYEEKSTLVMKGEDMIYFMDKDSLQCIQSVNLPPKITGNMRWIIQIGDYLVFQLTNQMSDILIYYNFHFSKKWSINEELIKPLVFTHNDQCFAVFCNTNGEVTLYKFYEGGFNSQHSIIIQQQENESMLEETITNTKTVIFMSYLQQTQLIAIGLKDYGIQFIKIDLDALQINQMQGFLNKHSIKSCVEIRPNQILAIQYQPTDYFLIDLANNTETQIPGGGYGQAGLYLTQLPNYDEVKFPYILCKEQGALSIYNPINNKMSSIQIKAEFQKPDITNPFISQDELIFDREYPNYFFTVRYEQYQYRTQWNLIKYEINPTLIEALLLAAREKGQQVDQQ